MTNKDKHNLSELRNLVIDDFEPIQIKKPTKEKHTKLSDKMARFAEEYIVDFNGSKAAIRAGYKESSSRVMAVKLLQNPLVIAEIERNKEIMRNKVFWTREQIEQKLLNLYEDMELDENPNRVAQIKLLELIMKYKGLFSETTPQQNNTQIVFNFNEIHSKPNNNINSDNFAIEENIEDVNYDDTDEH